MYKSNSQTYYFLGLIFIRLTSKYPE